MAHTYSHLYDLPTTGLRFFTVYGPWGRPDMAMFKFTQAVLEGRPIQVYNHGEMYRDFTYIDDIVEGIVRILEIVPQRDGQTLPSSPEASDAPYRLYNIGHGSPVALMDFVRAVETATGREAVCDFQPCSQAMSLAPGGYRSVFHGHRLSSTGQSGRRGLSFRRMVSGVLRRIRPALVHPSMSWRVHVHVKHGAT